jgi:RsiW-degrading membrane proteinase PrsW (M82 family)
VQQPTRFQWLSLGQLLLSGLGFLLFATLGVVLLLMGVAGLLKGSSAEALPFFSLMWVCGLVCLLVAPSVVLSFIRLLDKPRPAWQWRGSFRAASWAMLAWPFAVAAGTWISRTGTLDWLLLPPLQILAVALPLWWLIEFGRRGLPGSGPQRSWGILSTGLLVSPTIATVVELVVMGVLLVVFAVWLSAQPGAAEQMTLLAQRLANAGNDPEVLLRILRPIAMTPTVLISIILLTSGLVPLIEELIKPLGVWVLVGRKLTPAQGFVFGLLSGAAFALLESLGSVANPSGQEWLGLVLGRTGTGMLHTVTTGLMGWGLASAWQDRRYLRLAGTYLLAAGLHGLWNLFGIVLALPALFGSTDVTGIAAVLLRLGQIAPVVLGVLTLMLFSILLGSNRRLRAESGKIGISPQMEHRP